MEHAPAATRYNRHKLLCRRPAEHLQDALQISQRSRSPDSVRTPPRSTGGLTVRFLRILGRQLALGVVAAWAVLSAVFAFFSLTKDWVLEQRLGLLKFGGASDQELQRAREEYLGSRGLDRPLRARYIDWMGDMVTLDWGVSFETGEAVFPLVMDAAARTALYVLPAIGLGIVVGVLVGLYVAMYPDSRLANGSLGTAYLLFALPNFWLGGLLLSLAGGGHIPDSPLVFDHLLPVALTTTSLLGGYVSYSRAHSAEYVSTDFVTLVKAKGAGPTRIARHILRNAAIPLFSMVFMEALALLVLATFVIEFLFRIDGLGLLLFVAIQTRDIPVLMGGMVVVIGVGVLGNIFQDLSYEVLDPRVDTGRRQS